MYSPVTDLVSVTGDRNPWLDSQVNILHAMQWSQQRAYHWAGLACCKCEVAWGEQQWGWAACVLARQVTKSITAPESVLYPAVWSFGGLSYTLIRTQDPFLTKLTGTGQSKYRDHLHTYL